MLGKEKQNNFRLYEKKSCTTHHRICCNGKQRTFNPLLFKFYPKHFYCFIDYYSDTILGILKIDWHSKKQRSNTLGLFVLPHDSKSLETQADYLGFGIS